MVCSYLHSVTLKIIIPIPTHYIPILSLTGALSETATALTPRYVIRRRSARSRVTHTASVRQKLEEEANEATARLEVEAKARKENEELNIKLLKEKNELVSRLESERGSMGDEIAKQQKLQAQKADLEAQLNVSGRGSGTGDRGSGIGDRGSGIGDWGLGIGDRGPWIWDRGP